MKVALVHGLEDVWTTWLPFAEALGDRYDAVPLELPWATGNDYSWRRTARAGHWIEEGLDACGPVELVVAHSFGASAVLELLVAGRACVPAAVLLAPIFRARTGRPSWDEFDRCRASFDRQMRLAVSAHLGDRAGRIPPDILGKMGDKALERIGPDGFLTAFRQYEETSRLPLDRVRAPVLVIAGENDASLSVRQARTLADKIPGAVCVTSPALHHFSHVTSPADVVELAAPLLNLEATVELTSEGGRS